MAEKKKNYYKESQNNGQAKEIVSYTLPLLLFCSVTKKMLDLNFSSPLNIFPVG